MSLSNIVDVFPYFQEETPQQLPSNFKKIEPEPIHDAYEPVEDEGFEEENAENAFVGIEDEGFEDEEVAAADPEE